MIISVLRSIPFYFPLFLYTLGIVPNYTSDSITSSLISVPLLFVGLTTMLDQTMQTEQKRRRWMLGGIAILLFLAVIWLLSDSALLLSITTASLLLLFLVRKLNHRWRISIQGLIIFLLSYLSLTGFGLEQLLQFKILIFGSVAITYFAGFYSRSEIKWSFLLFLGAFLIVTVTQGTLAFYWPILLIFIPQLFGNVVNKKGIWIEIITILGLSGYFIYYLLYATYLIQALQGGF